MLCVPLFPFGSCPISKSLIHSSGESESQLNTDSPGHTQPLPTREPGRGQTEDGEAVFPERNMGLADGTFAFLSSTGQPAWSSRPPRQNPGNLPAYLLLDFIHCSKSPNRRECLRTIHSNEFKEPTRLLVSEHTHSLQGLNMSSWPSHIY